MSNIEYNFQILNYKIFEQKLISFNYTISMYYKDTTPGYYIESKIYFVDKKYNKEESIEDFIKIILDKECIKNIEDSSIFASCKKGLETKIIDCNLSLTNVSKY